jgi:hypothetical protein
MLTSCEYRSKTTLALVRTFEHISLTIVEQPAYTCQDVTTRGEYYPDKNMATAAVGSTATIAKVLLTSRPEPPALSSCHQHVQGRLRQGYSDDRRNDATGSS